MKNEKMLAILTALKAQHSEVMIDEAIKEIAYYSDSNKRSNAYFEAGNDSAIILPINTNSAPVDICED